MIYLIRVCISLLCVTMMQAATRGEELTITVGERQALVALYEKTGGHGWKKRGGWLGLRGTECSWYGVVCAANRFGAESGRLTVSEINLRNNGLKGHLPIEVGNLTGLISVMVDGNSLRTPIPGACRPRKRQRQPDISKGKSSFRHLIVNRGKVLTQGRILA